MVPYLRISNNQPITGINPIDLSQLDHDFFFHLGEKVSNGMSVTNEANLIKDFMVAHPKEKELILSQWNNLKKLLLGECTQKTIEFILPKEYVRWLRFSDYKPIYDNYYSGVETIPVMIDVKDLYEDVIDGTTGLFRTTCKKFQEESINSIIIDDCIDIETSTFVQKLKKKYPAVKYLSYSEWKSIQDKEERERQRKIQEQQEEEERLRQIAEAERIAKAKAEAEAKAKAEAEARAKAEAAEKARKAAAARSAINKGFSGAGTGQSASQGTGGGSGNQGVATGGAGQGTSIGDGSGNSYSLAGRNIVGKLPKPVYTVQEEGKVIVAITVDRNGNVTNATVQSKGTTVQNRTLWNVAVQAAKKAKFNTDPEKPATQSGTITYNFRLQ